MKKLSGTNRKYLRGLAHSFRPFVIIGYEGVTDSVMATINKGLDDHELVKVRFNKFKEEKKELSAQIEEKRKITLKD